MIASMFSDTDLVASITVAICSLGAAWLLGVGWAIYRAVGWVERMREWAGNVCDEHEYATLASATVDTQGGE